MSNPIIIHLDKEIARGTMPGWMIRARGELGQLEIPGPIDNPRIVEYHAITRGGPAPDDVAWCASFMCWLFQPMGIETPRTKRALDWLTWGVSCECTPGAVAVLDYGGGRGHVGLVVAHAPSGVWLLGGNQGNAVSVRAFVSTRIQGYRMPVAPMFTVGDMREPGTR